MDLDNDSNENIVPVQPMNDMDEVDKMDTSAEAVVEQKPAEPTIDASDEESMKAKLLPKSEELEVGEEFQFTWEIEDWNSLATLTEPKLHSLGYEADGFVWKILLFPEGNGADSVSLYLETTPIDQTFSDHKLKPEEWAICGQFGLVMWNPNDPTICHTSNAHHRFRPDAQDWGFTRFFDRNSLYTPIRNNQAMIGSDGRVNITAYVRTYKDPTGILWYNFVKYDPKKVTGCVGLENQGATCYLNSLLQSLYFTRKFRQLVYQIPTENEPPHNVSAALQRVFYLLHTSNTPIGTMQLIKAFGWDSGDAFTQHDVQELERVLMDKLESHMKGTKVEGELNNIFVAQMKSYIKCVNVDFESSRTEDFWDLQMNVKGMKTLEDSFKDYVQQEMLEGENQYQATGYGLQDAKKGVVFESFPPVLHLQLKRYEYDFMRDCMSKVNDRYEFPLEIDLAPYLDEATDKKGEPWVYSLHGVLVHAGDQDAGHYYALIKPTADDEWFRFDDDHVVRATLKEVLEDNYGADDVPPLNSSNFRLNRLNNIKRHSSAYMLVYIRKSRQQEILSPPGEDEIPSHIPERIEQERQEEMRLQKEREEMQYFTTVKFLSNAQLINYQGFDMGQWDTSMKRDGEQWNEQAQPVLLKLRKDSTMTDVYNQVAQQLQTDPATIRLWTMIARQNKTYRLDKPIPSSDATTLEQYRPRSNSRGMSEIRFWVENIEFDQDGNSIMSAGELENNQPESAQGKSLLFLKYFNRNAQLIHGAGTHTVNNQDTVADLAEFIKTKMNVTNQLKLYEEVKPDMVEQLSFKSTFHDAEISDGDIICFELVDDEEEDENGQEETLGGVHDAKVVVDGGVNKPFKTAPDFYEFMNNRVYVAFKRLEQPQDDGDAENTGEEFGLWLNKKHGYEEMSRLVGDHLGIDASHLQFFTTDTKGLKRAPIKRTAGQTVRQWLTNPYIQSYSNVLLYNVLDMSLDELEQKQMIQISYLTDGLRQEHKYEILVSKGALIGELKKLLIAKAEIPEKVIGNLKMWSASGGRMGTVLSESMSIDRLNKGVQIFVSQMPKEEAEYVKTAASQEEGAHDSNVGGDSKLVVVQHFQRDPSRLHGIPFTFVVKKNEPFKETKARLQKTLGVFDKVFENIKFALLKNDNSEPVYVDESTTNGVEDSSTEGDSDKESEPKQQQSEQPFVLFDAVTPDTRLGLDHYDKSVRRGYGQAAIRMR